MKSNQEELKNAFQAIADGCPYVIDYEWGFVTVENPEYLPDNGEDPNYVIMFQLDDENVKEQSEWGSNEWRDIILEILERRTAEIVAKGPEACRAELMKLGFWNSDGTLKDEFED